MMTGRPPMRHRAGMTDFSKHPVMRAQVIGNIPFTTTKFANDCRHVSGPPYTGSGPVTVQTPASSDYGDHHTVMYKALFSESRGEERKSDGAEWGRITSEHWTEREDPLPPEH
jgi:hypothetical protein